MRGNGGVWIGEFFAYGGVGAEERLLAYFVNPVEPRVVLGPLAPALMGVGFRWLLSALT